MTYSVGLRQRVVEYFASRHSLHITDAQASEFLDALAGLYACVAESGVARSGAHAAPDLITPHYSPVEKKEV